MIKIILLMCFLVYSQNTVLDTTLDNQIKPSLTRYYQILKMRDAELKGVCYYRIKVQGGKVDTLWLLHDDTYSDKLLARADKLIRKAKFGTIDTTFNYRIIVD